MRGRALLLAGLLALAGRAEAAIEQWLGKTIVDVRVRTVEGTGVDDGVLELVETRLGQPLAMAPVRDTIDHLIGLGRYDDVRLSAAAAPRWRRCRADVGACGRFSGSSGRPPPAAAIWRRAPCARPSSRASAASRRSHGRRSLRRP